MVKIYNLKNVFWDKQEKLNPKMEKTGITFVKIQTITIQNDEMKE
ncbi:MAG: hypothetical protein ACI4ES_16480 [Roseburia sp.]